MSAKFKARVAPWKRQEVENLTDTLRDASVVAIARIDKLPSKQFQDIRADVRQHATIRVTKNTLLERALGNLESDKDGIEQLEPYLNGQNALILTDANPFKLFKLIEGSKAKAPAKPGDLAPHDIKVAKGDTPFKPGPVVGDLQKAGLPAKIEGGKVVIAADKVVAKKGEEISADLAGALTRLDIHPMTVGLDVQVVWEDGTVFEREALDIDPQAFVTDLQSAHARAFALAIELAHPTRATMPALLTKAAQHGRGLATEAVYPAKGMVEVLLGRGQAHALALADAAGIDLEAPAAPAEPETSDEPPEAEEAEGEEEAADEAETSDDETDDDTDDEQAETEEAAEADEDEADPDQDQ